MMYIPVVAMFSPARKHFPLALVLAVIVMTSLLGACTLGPDFVRPDNELAPMTLEPRQRDDTLSADTVPAAWWALFGDATLTALQERARHASLDLLAASARVEQSRAQLGVAYSRSLPQLGFFAAYAREAISEHGKFAALGAPTRPGDFWQTGFDASWEIDLWGRLARAREGADALLEARLYDREAARVALSAEIARAYLQLRGVQARIEVTAENREIAERIVRLTENRERNGVATRFETSSARARLVGIDALAHDLTPRRDRLMNALSLLLGEAPRALDAGLTPVMPMPALPDEIPTGLPSELARRRPDILRVEAELHAATAAIGVAQADFYPRVSLQGKLGVEAFEPGDLDTWNSRFFSAGPTVYLPIFQGGRLKQQLALSEARQKSAAIAYRQTVLRAWHEVDDALNDWSAARRRHDALVLALEWHRQALTVAEHGYREGSADYLAVLSAQRDVLSGQMALNDSMTESSVALVNLYKALGGGWDPAAFSAADSDATR